MLVMEINDNALAVLANFIRESTGINFDETNWIGLKIALKERLKVHSLATPTAYLRILETNPREFDELISLITVPETYFYRDRRQFDALTQCILPEIMARKARHGFSRPSVKIVSCGCSIGAEPYSIAIAIHESGYWGKAQFDIIAFDINHKIIDYAKRAVYNNYHFRESQTNLTPYFHRKEGAWILKDAIKNSVQFYHENIFKLTDVNFTLYDADVVFFRNVLIYFNEEGIQEAIATIGRNMSREGYLFLGYSESLLRRKTQFELAEIGSAFVWRLSRQMSKTASQPSRIISFSPPVIVHESPALAALPDSEEKISLSPIDSEEESQDADIHYENALGYYAIKEIAKAEQEFQKHLKSHPRHLQSHVGLADIYAGMEKEALAISYCRKAIDIDILAGDAYFILGKLHYRNREFEKAVENFKKTIYSDTTHFLAHYYLAMTYRALGQKDDANRQFRVTIETIEQLGPEGLRRELAGHTGNYIVSLCIDNIV